GAPPLGENTRGALRRGLGRGPRRRHRAPPADRPRLAGPARRAAGLGPGRRARALLPAVSLAAPARPANDRRPVRPEPPTRLAGRSGAPPARRPRPGDQAELRRPPQRYRPPRPELARDAGSLADWADRGGGLRLADPHAVRRHPG